MGVRALRLCVRGGDMSREAHRRSGDVPHAVTALSEAP